MAEVLRYSVEICCYLCGERAARVSLEMGESRETASAEVETLARRRGYIKVERRTVAYLCPACVTAIAGAARCAP